MASNAIINKNRYYLIYNTYFPLSEIPDETRLFGL